MQRFTGFGLTDNQLFANVLCIIWFIGMCCNLARHRQPLTHGFRVQNCRTVMGDISTFGRSTSVWRRRLDGEGISLSLSSSSIQQLRFASSPCRWSRRYCGDRMLMCKHRLAFYFRIFPFRQFRNILLVVAFLSLGYGISIDVTILFQW